MEEQRSRIGWYVSYSKTLRKIQDHTQQLRMMWAIVDYGIYDIEPDFSDDVLLDVLFESVRANIDSSKKSVDDGKKGGRSQKDTDPLKGGLKGGLKGSEKGLKQEEEKEKEKIKEQEEKEDKKNLPPTPQSGGTSSNQPEPAPPPKPVNALYKSVAGRFFDLYIKRGNKDVMTFRGVKALETLIDEMGCTPRDIDRAVAFAKGGELGGFQDPKYNRIWQPHPVWNKSVSSLEDLTLTDPNGNLRINKILADMDAEATATFNPVQMGGSYM